MNFRYRFLVGGLLASFSLFTAYMYGEPGGKAVDAKKPAVPAPSKFSQAGELTAKTDPTTPPSKQELFVGWSKPEVAIVISGQQYGYVEPCGCTGLEFQKGGLARRHTFLKELTARGWDIIPLDAGNQVRRYGMQAELQFQFTADALKKMKYRGVGFGADDARLSATLLLSQTNNLNGDTPFLCANVAPLERSVLPQFSVIEAGGKKIGVTAFLGEAHRKNITSSEMIHVDPLTALKEVTPKLVAAKCDHLILLAFASEAETKTLSAKFPQYDLVVLASQSGEPAFEPEAIDGTKNLLIRTGAKGMYMVVLGIYNDKEKPLRYERVPLDDRFQDSPDMRSLMADYQNQLQQIGLADLGVKPQPHPTRQRFKGTNACADCHPKAYAVWQTTTHAHATDSLFKPKGREDVARHFDPECLSCHVTGWDAQGYYPYLGGYASLEGTPELKQNGCENCHGPSSEHVAAETGGKSTPAELKRLRLGMRLSLEPLKKGEKSPAERKCMECHDIDNSPSFHADNAFLKYWKQVEHKGKD